MILNFEVKDRSEDVRETKEESNGPVVVVRRGHLSSNRLDLRKLPAFINIKTRHQITRVKSAKKNHDNKKKK